MKTAEVSEAADAVAAAAPTPLREFDVAADTRVEFTREQLRAINLREPVVALSAGAGSGKTTVLVERFVDLVDEGTAPSRILAITYTEKAAAEMKERIVRRFEDRGDDANRRAAESAYISTIHGFCARLLRENPLAAGIDTSFAVLGDMERGMFLDEQLDEMSSDAWFRDTFALFPKPYTGDPKVDAVTPPTLFELIRSAAFDPADFGKDSPPEGEYGIEGHVRAALARLDAYWDRELRKVRDVLIAERRILAGLTVTGAVNGPKYQVFEGLIARLTKDSVPDQNWARAFCNCSGFTGSVKDIHVEQVRAVVKAARPTMVEFHALDLEQIEAQERDFLAPMKVEIHRRAKTLRLAFTEWKRANNLLDFEDLQRFALALLEHPEVRAEYGNRFQHILLDEAQDANDIQIAIVESLRRDGQGLFAVGDVKQAIYGFRGANVSLFQGIHADAGNGKLSLVDNYRSRPEVLTFVNSAGDILWDGDNDIAYERLQPKVVYPVSTRQHVQMHLLEQLQVLDPKTGKSKVEPAEDVREREALVIASWIRDAVEGTKDRGPLEVLDPNTKKVRPAQWKDVAILSYTRWPLGAYERSLATLGVPFVKDGGRGFFAGAEVQDLLAALKVISNPLDDIATLTVLRSPLFGWADLDLVRLRDAAGQHSLWSAIAKGFAPEQVRSTAGPKEVFASLRSHAPFATPAELIDMVCELTAYRAAILRDPTGRAQVANIEKLEEFARSSEALDGPSLEVFLRRASLAKKYLIGESDAPLSSTGDDAVTLSTIHGAKGLEWPIVILAALDSDFARGDFGSRYSPADEALIVDPKDETGKARQSPVNDVLKTAAKRRDEAEAKRLFYVGMTRAREYLVLTGRTPYGASRSRFGSPLEWVRAQLNVVAASESDQTTKFGGGDVRVFFQSPDRVSALHDAETERREKELAAVRHKVGLGAPLPLAERNPEAVAIARDIIERSTSPKHTWSEQHSLVAATVTQLVYFARCPLVYYFNLVLQVEEHPAGRKKAQTNDESTTKLPGLKRGTIVHELLELANFSADPIVEAKSLISSRSDIPTGELAKVEGLLVNVLRDPLMERARTSRRLEREYPFYMSVGGTALQGVIDLVFEDKDGRGVVVDYKSNDLAAPNRLNVLTKHYQPQIELYALAASRAGLVEPSEATLYFLNKSAAQTIAITPDRLTKVEQETAEMIAKIAQGRWDTEPGEKCRACGYRKRGFCEVGKRFVE